MSEHHLGPWNWVRDTAEHVLGPHPLQALRGRIDQLFDEMYEKIGKQHHAVSGGLPGETHPNSDVSETEKGFHFAMELPGVEEADIEILVAEDLLTVKGEKRAEKEVAERHFFLTERSYGRFERGFRLPPYLDTDKTTATFRNGILDIRIPRKKGVQSTGRRIEIKSR